MAGFGAGHVLEAERAPFVCYDRNPYYGGHTRSFRYDSGFVFDEGGHISFTKDDHVRDVLAENVDGRHEQRRLPIDNLWHGRRIAHPVQCNLHGLPSELIVDVISDFVAACQSEPAPTDTYAQWLHATYGKTFAETFPIVYGRKYHTTTMDQLTTDWIGPRMYRPSLQDVLRGALGKAVDGAHYVDTFRYPSVGGFMTYLEPFAQRFELRLNHELIGVDTREKLLRFANGNVERYGAVISSIPLPELIPLIDGVPDDVLEAARKLAFTTAVLFNLGIDRVDLSETAITYFYDEDVIVSRVNLPHMFSPNNAPPGCGTIQAEVYFSDKYKPLRGRPEDLIERVVSDLRRCGFIRDSDSILLEDTAISRYANVIFDLDRAAALRTVHGFLDDVQIHYCGRYGNWDHAWTDQAFVSGEETARNVLNRI
ncbi:MAG: NAD(P)-binding protein [Luteitalea sp.]|nr:NAD(P)-binding protein [Luteitalea sp.]